MVQASDLKFDFLWEFNPVSCMFKTSLFTPDHRLKQLKKKINWIFDPIEFWPVPVPEFLMQMVMHPDCCHFLVMCLSNKVAGPIELSNQVQSRVKVTWSKYLPRKRGNCGSGQPVWICFSFRFNLSFFLPFIFTNFMSSGTSNPSSFTCGIAPKNKENTNWEIIRLKIMLNLKI